MTPLSAIAASLDQGWSPKCLETASSDASDWAVIKTTAIQSLRFEAAENKQLPANLPPRPHLQILAGDILITRAGPRSRVGICCYVSGCRPRLLLCDKAYRLRVQSKLVEAQYVAWMLNCQEIVQQIEAMKSGISDSGLNLKQEAFLALKIPVPPLAEQRRIVARIEALFARTRRARTDLERIAALSAQYQKSLLEAVFFQENEGSGSSHMRPFFDVLDFKGGTQPPKATFSEAPNPGFIRLLQIRDFASDNKAIYIKDSSNWSKCAANDILVGRYGASVGKILRGKAGAYNVALVKMIADWTRVDRDYLFNWLQSPAFQNCVLGVSRSAQNGFNKGDLANLTFPLLDLASQKSLSRRLEAASDAGKAINRDAKHALALLERLEQSILARAFRGELVPQSLPHDLQHPAKAVDPIVTVSPRRGRRAAA